MKVVCEMNVLVAGEVRRCFNMGNLSALNGCVPVGEEMPMTPFERVQKRMLKAYDEMQLSGKGSGRFNGDVCCRILKRFLTKEIGPEFRICEPNAYILGSPCEYDLLILDGNSKRTKFTNAFSSENVKCEIEVKSLGIAFSGNPAEDVRKLKERFERDRRKFPGIEHVCFIFQETSPRNRSGIDYCKETCKGLKPFKAFCLRNRRTGELRQGQWQKFVKCIRKMLKML